MDLICTMSDAHNIVKCDSSRAFADSKLPKAELAKAKDAFVRKNVHQVYLGINAWYGIIESLQVPCGLVYDLHNVLVHAGLVPVVTASVHLAEGVLEGLGQMSSGAPSYTEWRAFCSDLDDRTYAYPLAQIADFVCYDSGLSRPADRAGRIRACLQVLLFLERFTYIGSDPTSSFEKLLKANAKCREYEYDWSKWPGTYVTELVRSEMRKIYTQKDWSWDDANRHFSSGVCSDAKRTLISKLRRLAKHYPNYCNQMFYPFPNGENRRRKVSYPTLTPVPKNLTSYRVIAPEDVVLSYSAQGALESLRNMLHANGTMEYINEQDQSINKGLAKVGSAFGSYATIDMSSASDSIGRAMFIAHIPPAFAPMFLNYASGYCMVPGRGAKKLFLLFTSGNPLCWLNEACWFLGLGRSGCILCGADPDKVFAYGDDLLVPTEAYETVVELLELFGHTVNRRKSYGAGVFRESCGGWYMLGEDITPAYWPRRAVTSDKPDLVQTLSDLQHKSIERNFTQLDSVCRELARTLKLQITDSTPGSAFTDFWNPAVNPVYDEMSPHTTVRSMWKHPGVAHDDLYDHYVYYQYLQHGPSYASELDRLLNVTQSRINYARDFGEAKLTLSEARPRRPYSFK